jgi:protein phosphatase
MSQNHTDLTFTLGFRTDIGRQRSNNEDAVTTFNVLGAEAAFVVCDGMGGLRAGDIAAQEAVRVVEVTLTEILRSSTVDPIKALGEAFRDANDAVNRLAPIDETAANPARNTENAISTAQQEPQGEKRRLMGTTCVAGVVRNNILYLAHAGDSRAYRWRRGHLTRLTEDHSFVAERVRAGDMTEAEARVSRFRNIVTRAIGIDASIEPEFRREPLEPGDLVLVCSDGLTTMLDDPEIAAALNRPTVRRASAEQTAAMLVESANRAGGSDNITVLILKVDGEPIGQDIAGIIDIDAPKSRPPKSGSPYVWLILGILLTLIVLLALFFLSRPFRQRIGQLAIPTPTVTGSVGTNPETTLLNSTTGSVDFRDLVYDPPVRFGDYLARGDLLTYAPGKYLYFVAAGSGKVARMNATGEAVLSVETLEVADTPAKFPSTHVFLTSDAQGNIYISYTNQRIIVKKGPDGKRLAVLKGFQQPEAIAVDERGNIYVIDFNSIKVLHAHLPTPTPSPSASVPAIVTPRVPAKGQS